MEAHQDCCMKFLDVHLTGPRNKQTQKQFLGDQNIFWRTNWLSQNCLSYCKVGLHQQLFFLASDCFWLSYPSKHQRKVFFSPFSECILSVQIWNLLEVITAMQQRVLQREQLCQSRGFFTHSNKITFLLHYGDVSVLPPQPLRLPQS